MDRNALRAVVVFVLVYVALYLLGFFASSLGFSPWLPGSGPLDISAFHLSRIDYSIWLLPVVGFFMVYMAMPWLRKEFGFGELFNYSFPALFFVGAYLAFAVVLAFYFQNQASLSRFDLATSLTMGPFPDIKLLMVVPGSNPPQVAGTISTDAEFLKSAFIYFTLAGLGGWGARLLINNLEENKSKKQQ